MRSHISFPQIIIYNNNNYYRKKAFTVDWMEKQKLWTLFSAFAFKAACVWFQITTDGILLDIYFQHTLVSLLIVLTVFLLFFWSLFLSVSGLITACANEAYFLRWCSNQLAAGGQVGVRTLPPSVPTTSSMLLKMLRLISCTYAV